MRVPISYALTYPERAATPIQPLDLASGVTLEFHAPDLDTFPMLSLARDAGERGGTYPCAFNAANEVAVAAFLAGEVSFGRISEIIEAVLDDHRPGPATSLAVVREADQWARGQARDHVRRT
jgi:1-deoxy-D-xylulose-5-phosphate reductoisomerase